MAETVAELAARAIAISEQAARTQEAIVRQQWKSKRNIRLIAGSLVVDIILSVALFVLAANQASVSGQIHDSQVTACGIGNAFRASQMQVWDHFIARSVAPPHETAAERAARLKRLADARAYIAGHYRPVDCTALYGK